MNYTQKFHEILFPPLCPLKKKLGTELKASPVPSPSCQALQAKKAAMCWGNHNGALLLALHFAVDPCECPLDWGEPTTGGPELRELIFAIDK